jgi:glycosyltransferase involved in cell wall biosynthesis
MNPMQIILVTQDYPSQLNPARGIFIHQQALALLERGHDVQVVHYLRRMPFWRQARASYPEFEEIDDVPVKRVWYYWPSHRLFDFGWCAAIARVLHNPVKQLLKPGPVIIYAQWLLPTAAACLQVGQALHVPVAGIARGYDLTILAHRSKNLYRDLKQVWQKANAVMSNGEWARPYVQELGFDPSIRHLVVVRNIKDLTEYLTMSIPIRQREELRIITVAALEERKGLDILFRAVATLAGFDFRVEVLGDGSRRLELEALVADLRLQDKVSFRGRLSHPEVSHALAQSHIFVLPSRREGVPNALIEAMASALGCIASTADGIPELIANGQNGLLVPKEDPVALAKAITIFAQDETFRQQCGLQARRHVQAMYSYDENLDRLERALTAALQG